MQIPLRKYLSESERYWVIVRTRLLWCRSPLCYPLRHRDSSTSFWLGIILTNSTFFSLIDLSPMTFFCIFLLTHDSLRPVGRSDHTLTVSLCSGAKPHSRSHQKKGCIRGITRNCIWWWGSSFGALENVDSFPSLIWLTMAVTIYVQIDRFKNDLYSIGIFGAI